ncbi:PREDICTED: plastid-lipid-associated protein, chloroplastic-like [Nelumbo nucifera]|uniref:Plastid lipid-associated protein/fibrillin conserved domain-containing protein n=2 Tax=Nelumbo nucifera TaxID=4432 RepID=A0A822XKX1_NELNU|nr:PREDICTED: plastid-lipid-associated protein, chloroplastic-like [Nelumbo nucifera]DAD20373.1 TPA_asm: hypothetical protein HUJ06_021836 [Nelumbo nucifera]
MAAASSVNTFPCKTLSLTQSQRLLGFNKNSFSPVNSIGVTSRKPITRSTFSIAIGEHNRVRPILRIRAVGDAVKRAEDEPIGEGVISMAAAAVDRPEKPSDIDMLKKLLFDSFIGTDRGLRASSEARAEIDEVISQLEALNPTPAPTEAFTLLNGKWIVAYTSLAGWCTRGKLPMVKVEEISQTIDSSSFTLNNEVQFICPLSTTSFRTNAKFEVRSPKRIQVWFEENITITSQTTEPVGQTLRLRLCPIISPQLTDAVEIPETVEFVRQKLGFCLCPLNATIRSVKNTASSVVRIISSQLLLKVLSSNTNSQSSWLLTTYLDNELRIARGDGGNVFVLIKEGSSLLAY